jgi:hypothetical protein
MASASFECFIHAAAFQRRPERIIPHVGLASAIGTFSGSRERQQKRALAEGLGSLLTRSRAGKRLSC